MVVANAHFILAHFGYIECLFGDMAGLRTIQMHRIW
jgi:hypothetical protein